jgi:hypothetical protein
MEQSPSEKLKVTHPVKKFTALYKESEGSLPCSQEPAIGPCPDPDKSRSHFPTLFP